MVIFELVERVVTQISDLDFQRDAPLLASHNLQVNPEYCREYASRLRDEGMRQGNRQLEQITPDGAAYNLAEMQLSIIKSLPRLASRIKEFIEQKNGTAPERAAMLSLITYLAQPQDILPDNLPGGVGFLDDALIILIVAKELLPLLRPTAPNEMDIDFAARVLEPGIPRESMPSIQMALEAVWQIFQTIKMMEPSQAELILDQLVNNQNPLSTSLAQNVPQSTALPPTPVVSSMAGGGSVWSEPGYVRYSFSDGSGCAMLGNDILVW